MRHAMGGSSAVDLKRLVGCNCGRTFTLDDEYKMLVYVNEQKEKGV